MGIAVVLTSKAAAKVSARILKAMQPMAELLSDANESFKLAADEVRELTSYKVSEPTAAHLSGNTPLRAVQESQILEDDKVDTSRSPKSSRRKVFSATPRRSGRRFAPHIINKQSNNTTDSLPRSVLRRWNLELVFVSFSSRIAGVSDSGNCAEYLDENE